MMRYVVFYKSSPHADKRYFSTAASAKRSTTCANRNAGREAYAFMEETLFMIKHPIGKRVTKNLMTGEIIIIPEDTPWCCNPASETYWSM